METLRRGSTLALTACLLFAPVAVADSGDRSGKTDAPGESTAQVDSSPTAPPRWSETAPLAPMRSESSDGGVFEIAGAGLPCASDADRADNDPCTDDLCLDALWTHAPECLVNDDCDDNNVCTIDECIDGCCESRPQCFGHDDCDENFICDYNCCIRCPSCHDIRRMWVRCRRGRVQVGLLLRNEDCIGNTLTLDVGGTPVECEVDRQATGCRLKGVCGDVTVCVSSPDCPELCESVSCRR